MPDGYVRTRRPGFLTSGRDILVHGVVGGLIGGAIWLGFQVLMALALGLAPLVPLRFIAAILLGSGSLPAAASVGAVLAAGIFMNFVVAIVAALIFVALVALIPALARSAAVLVLAGAFFGTIVWIVNFFVIAPFLFPWFTGPSALVHPLIQFPAHAIFYGAPLGAYLASVRRGRV